MSNPEHSLPEAWVERIWLAMRATYGASFDRQWETPAGADPVEHVRGMKAFWARELGGFRENPDAIKYALEHLPEHPPNLVKFKSLCIARPEYVQPQLPAPKADPAMVAVASTIAKAIAARPSMEWAHELRRREQRCERLTAAQRQMWREALRQQPEPA